MKRNIARLLLSELLTVSVEAQRPNDITGVTVSRVRKGKSADKQKRSAIEITLSSGMRTFYMGDLYYYLQIGKVTASPAGGSRDNRKLMFLSKQQRMETVEKWRSPLAHLGLSSDRGLRINQTFLSIG